MENFTELYLSNPGLFHGNITKIPFKLLKYISTNGECPEERKQRELIEGTNHICTHQPLSDKYYFGIYDSIDQFTNWYFSAPTPGRIKFESILNKIFAGVLGSGLNQVINSRGNGLCAYNCFYLFLKTTRPDILDLFGSSVEFNEFKLIIRDMAVGLLNPEIKDFMISLIDDPSTPDLDPIFNAFVDFTGINILMININNNEYTYTKSKFSHRDFPSDYLVLIRNACHLMYLHTTGDFTHRQHMYQLVDSNSN